MSAPIKDVVAACGLTPRDVELSLKALITMLDSDQKPDYNKLSKIAGFKDSLAANKGFWATRKKLQAVKIGDGSDGADGTGNDDAAPVETPKRKRKGSDATNTPASKTPKRGRGRPKKNAEPAADNGGDEAGGQAGADVFDAEV